MSQIVLRQENFDPAQHQPAFALAARVSQIELQDVPWLPPNTKMMVKQKQLTSQFKKN
jgi:anaerobic glycerol-3-phosphate dehydrogenase